MSIGSIEKEIAGFKPLLIFTAASAVRQNKTTSTVSYENEKHRPTGSSKASKLHNQTQEIHQSKFKKGTKSCLPMNMIASKMAWRRSQVGNLHQLNEEIDVSMCSHLNSPHDPEISSHDEMQYEVDSLIPDVRSQACNVLSTDLIHNYNQLYNIPHKTEKPTTSMNLEVEDLFTMKTYKPPQDKKILRPAKFLQNDEEVITSGNQENVETTLKVNSFKFNPQYSPQQRLQESDSEFVFNPVIVLNNHKKTISPFCVSRKEPEVVNYKYGQYQAYPNYEGREMPVWFDIPSRKEPEVVNYKYGQYQAYPNYKNREMPMLFDSPSSSSTSSVAEEQLQFTYFARRGKSPLFPRKKFSMLKSTSRVSEKVWIDSTPAILKFPEE